MDAKTEEYRETYDRLFVAIIQDARKEILNTARKYGVKRAKKTSAWDFIFGERLQMTVDTFSIELPPSVIRRKILDEVKERKKWVKHSALI